MTHGITPLAPSRPLPRTSGKPLPVWRQILRLPRALAELRAYRRMDRHMMRDAGLTVTDLESATLANFLRQPSR